MRLARGIMVVGAMVALLGGAAGAYAAVASGTVYVAHAADTRLPPAESTVARRVLVLYDSAEEKQLAMTQAHRRLAMPLEYLGLVVDYADVEQPLPADSLRGRYAGVVSWFTDDEMTQPERFRAFVRRQLDDGVKVVFMENVGCDLDDELLARLGLAAESDRMVPPFRTTTKDRTVGFEVPAPRGGREVAPWFGARLTRHVEVKDAKGRTASPVVTAAWGGMALEPFAIELGWRERVQWVVDPFTFLSTALALPPVPVPDFTTENGSRLLTVHIDGDGFPSMAEMPGGLLASEIVRRELLGRYRVPTTVSVVEGETGAAGLYPKMSPKLEVIARDIFQLSHVEIASHSYAHAFDWARAAGQKVERDIHDEEATAAANDPAHLEIPGYTWDVAREIEGSVRYIDQRLAPEGKRTKVFLWSGTALPLENAIALTETIGLSHMNGYNGDEPIDGRHLLASVPSLGRPVGKVFQVYAPAQNEMAYTNDWHGPYYGFRRVVDGFKFTDAPRRLKPISIYYHFYSGAKLSALQAVKDAYDYAMTQEVRPLFVSEYTAKVRDFQSASIVQRADGSFVVDGVANLRTLRLPQALGWPDLARSKGVVGVRDLPQGRYLALDGSRSVTLYFRDRPPTGPYLNASNGAVVTWRRDSDQRVVARLSAGAPSLSVAIAGCSNGAALEETAGRSVRRFDRIGGAEKVTEFIFPSSESSEVTFVCR